MKHVLLYASVLLIAGASVFCKNKSAAAATEVSQVIPADRPDSLYGYPGCDVAGFHAISATEREFIYQDFKVHIGPNPIGGEDIHAIPMDSTKGDLKIIHEGPSYFKGVSHGQLLIEEDKGADAPRELAVYQFERKALMFRMAFCGDIQIASNGNLRFFTPVEEADVTNMPECPEKEEWAKKGMGVMYGQRCLFSLTNRTLTKKSEYTCLPKKKS